MLFIRPFNQPRRFTLSLQDISDRRAELAAEGALPAVIGVYDMFLRMPTQVGCSIATGLRPLDLSRLTDYRLLLDACEQEISRLEGEFPLDHSLIQGAFDEAWVLRLS